jgi:pimeloyl-ACP methyl ester carboxylesterase
VLGLSFAGGLALLTAADPRYAEHVAFVVSIGSHDDMSRVAEFFATGQIVRPDGTAVSLKPHEYGPLVLMYSHPEEFFPPQDAATAREVLRLLLWEQVEDSKEAAGRLSPASQKVMERIYAHDQSQVQAMLRAAITRHSEEMAKVSPRGQLSNLHVPVLLLHGAGDDVIPATELLWLQKEIPEKYLRAALTTPLLSHVTVAGEPPVREKLALVHFMAELFDLADASKISAKKVN